MEINSKSINIFFRLAVAFCAMLYFFGLASSRSFNSFFDSLNLVFHEAGHAITFLFPEPIMIAAGSFFQILVPLVLALYFFAHEVRYSGSLVLFWVGESIVNVSVYVGDAIDMKLPLLGGDNVIHDWNYLLSFFGVLEHAEFIALTVYSVGIAFLIGASTLSFFYARPPRRHDLITYAGALISHEGKVLLVQEAYEEALGLWSFPMGSLIKKEEVDDATRRIVAEKAGYTVGLFSVPTVVLTSGINIRAQHDEALCSVRVYLFNGTVIGECNPFLGLVQDIRWFSLKEIEDLPLRAEWMRMFVRSLKKQDGMK